LDKGNINLSFTGFSDDEFISEQITFPFDNIVPADSLLREMWVGNHIKTLDNAQEIIKLSRAERVLSDFTAFLAVDLENGANPCHTCDIWGWAIVAVEDQEENSEAEKIEIGAAPNPFSDQVTINIDVTNIQLIKDIQVQIFDVMGSLVLNDEIKTNATQDILQWTWDGKNASGQKMPTGIYYAVIQLDGKLKTIKLILI